MRARPPKTALLLALASTAVAGPSTLAAGNTMTLTAHSRAAVLERTYTLINAARVRPRRCGTVSYPAVPPLTVNPLLQQAAAGHAQDMARWNFFDHTGHDGSAPRDRVARTGFRSVLTGENIAYGPDSAEELVSGWLASPGHCENLMDRRFIVMGLAFSIEPRRRAPVWVLDEALPSKNRSATSSGRAPSRR